MTQKTSTAAVIGGGMATGPAFYESTLWLSAVAVLGLTVLILTVVNSALMLRRNIKQGRHKQKG